MQIFQYLKCEYAYLPRVWVGFNMSALYHISCLQDWHHKKLIYLIEHIVSALINEDIYRVSTARKVTVLKCKCCLQKHLSPRS